MTPVDPRVERDASDPLIGRLLDGRYRIGARVARGGMASVYEATDVRLDRVVAVKVMHPGMGDGSADDDFAQRFVREARAAARLSDPHVVGVFDQGTDGHDVFLVMEFVPGHTLRDVIRAEAPLSPRRALALLEPVVSALAAAPKAGVIHRGIKPENVLISESGTVKVADFGLAKAISADTQHTATGGVLIGTVSYLAPELVVDGRADARADVYAAGVVLYELLTGQKPHQGESPIQVAYKHVHEDIPAPSELVPGLPAYVDALVARATARDRGLRPADGTVLLRQLHRVRNAVDAGVREDPELLADLALPVAVADAGFDDAAFDDDVEHTTEESADFELYDQASDEGWEGDDWEGTAVVGTQTRSTPAVQVWEPPHRSRRGPVLLVVALVLALLVGIGAWWFGFARYTTTPDVIGLTAGQAEAKVEAAGLEFDGSDRAYSETVEAGRVIKTDPGSQHRILPGDTVHAVISRGKERYAVPDLRGKTEDEAQQLLADTHLSFGHSTQKYDPVVPEGQVVTSTPAAGEMLRRDTAVDLVISKGPKPITIVDWTGKPFADAQKWASTKKLTVAKTEEFSDSVPAGSVISQDPTTGDLFKGDTITFVVSKGPELVAIPRVVAMGVQAAHQALEGAGFVVQEKHSSVYLGLGYVTSVSPGEGQKAPRGSTVTIYLV
jgi:serine/threonine-protein kinase